MPAAAAPVRSLPERAWKRCAAPAIRSATTSRATPTTRFAPATTSPSCSPGSAQQLLGVVDLYRYAPSTHSEVVPVLGNKGSGKTHLLHSIKHGPEGTWQLLVTPGTYQRDVDFLEYLLFQVIDTLLGGGRQKDARPLEFVGEQLVRGLLGKALDGLTPEERLDLFPAAGPGPLGAALRPRRLAGPGADAVADRPPRPAGRPAVPGRRRPPRLRRGRHRRGKAPATWRPATSTTPRRTTRPA